MAPRAKKQEEGAPSLEDLQRGLRLLKRQQKALSARENLMDFVKFTSPDPDDPDDAEKSRYKNARHHDAIARVLEEVVEGNIRFLVLTMPPRHGKSELVSRRLPAWLMGRFPDQHGIVATYNDDFAADFGKEVRGIVKTPQFRHVFPGVSLERGGAASDRLRTTRGGQWSFVGRGGSLTGRGGHILICDDLIKDDKEAQSKAIRDAAWSWLTKVAMTRRMGKKLVIMTFTRWHADDPIGRLTDPENECYNEKLAQQIRVINFPAIAEDDDPLGRAPGEPLWPDGPDQFDLDFLEEQRAMDPLGFEALYQQRPSVADGVLFRRENIQYYDPGQIDESDMRIYCASDHAVETKQRSDSTVLLRVGIDKNNHIYLLDCWWQKARSDAVVEAMLMMARKTPKPLIWWAERGHISKSIGPFLRKRMAEDQVFFNLVEVTPAGDKEQRAQSISARVAMGYVYFPRGRPWVEKAINEMLSFPNGLHDDFVDALAYIGLGLQSQFPVNKKASVLSPSGNTFGRIKAEQRRHDQAIRLTRLGGF